MSEKLRPTTILTAALRPLVRFCLKRGVRAREVEEILRTTLVEEAKSAIEQARGEVSVSKISVITGINRPEVTRLLAGEKKAAGSHDLLNRIIGLWSQRAAYRGKDGTPRGLTHHGLSSEFARLVAAVSKEVNHYPILFELERIGAIRYEGERVYLTVSEYIPQGDVEHGLGVLSEDIGELLSSVESNLTAGTRLPHLHLRTSYDGIASDKLDEIRRWVLKRGGEFQSEVRDYLSKFDADTNPELPQPEKRAKVSVGSFAFSEVIDQIKELKPRKRGRKPLAETAARRKNRSPDPRP